MPLVTIRRVTSGGVWQLPHTRCWGDSMAIDLVAELLDALLFTKVATGATLPGVHSNQTYISLE